MCPRGQRNSHQSTRPPPVLGSSNARDAACGSPQSGQLWIPVMNVAMPVKLDPAADRSVDTAQTHV